MGHHRLGRIPKGKKWDAVVAAMAQESGLSTNAVAELAAKTLDAAAAGLEKGINDPGLCYAFYALTQLVLAGRETDWENRLARIGIQLDRNSTIFDLTSQVQYAIDNHVARHGGPTDVSEIAQQALGEAIISMAGSQSASLFGEDAQSVHWALKELSTTSGFSKLGQTFFGGFTARFLDFYLSRVSAAQLGSQALPDVHAVSDLNDMLRTHCHQSARIVRDFCGQWYSRTEFQQGIDLQLSSGFMAVAIRKLKSEIGQQRLEL